MTDASSIPSSAVIAVVATLVVTGLVVDAVAKGGAVTVEPDVELSLLAGSSTCAALEFGDTSTVTTTTVVAPPEDAEEAAASLVVATDGDQRRVADPAVDGSVGSAVVTGEAGPGAATMRWYEAPGLLSRRWEVDSTQRVPGTVEGPCPSEPATDWVVPGVATAGGAAGVLHIANPTDGPASLAVTFTTPDGPVAPTRLANLAVPAHDQITVDLNEFVPEEPDLGVVVRARAGRVVAEVVETLEAAVGGVDGRALVTAQPQLRETWTMPWLSAGEQESAWVWVTNPGDQPTDVRLVLHTDTGPVVPPDSGVTLEPGTTRRIDLRGALAEVATAAVTVRSAPGVPIAASGGVLRLVEDDAERSGVVVLEALGAGTGPHAAMSAVGASGQDRRLLVANPGEEDAVVDVRIVGASAAVERQVATGLRVPAGSRVGVDVDEELPDTGAFAVVVDVVEGVAASVLVAESREGPLDLTAVAARPFPATVMVPQYTVVRDDSLLHPIDATELGPSDAAAPDRDPSGDAPRLGDEPSPEASPTPSQAP